MNAAIHDCADAQILSSLHAQCFDEAWTQDAIVALLASPGAFAMTAQDSGFILVRVAADEAEILSIGVSPSARKTGLGTALAAAGAARATGAGATSMFLEVDSRNHAAKALYDKLGFQAVGHRRAYYGPQGDALVLKAALPLTFHLGNPRETA